jgi:hypothetical protein
MFDPRKCTAETMGKVVALYNPPQEKMMIAVEYTVDGKMHTVEETMQYKVFVSDKDNKERNLTCMPFYQLGLMTPIMYDPTEPRHAYIKNNRNL